MVASVAKTPTYAERAKKAQSIKAPASIRPSTSVSSPIQPTAPQSSTAPKSHPKSPVVDVLVAAGPSSSLASQDTGLANVNAVNDHVSTTASSTSASSPSMGHPTPHNTLISSTPGTTKVPVDNVWNRRKEQMVSRATTTSTPSSSIQQVAATPAATPISSEAAEDPFVVRIPPRTGPPATHDSESWPEVGKSTPSADSKEGSTTGKDTEPTIRKGEKQKWVPIPAAELQAAADAQNQNQKSSSSKQHSRAQSRAQSQKGTNTSRSNNSITTSTTHSGSQNASRAASQAHSRIQSTSHSRIASRSTSAQSSPRLSRGGRKLEDDSSSLITNNVDNNISNLNGSPYVSPRNVNTPPTQVPPQPVTYVDTPSSDPPPSYPVPLYGPIPISGSPYYQSHDHGSLPLAHPLPIQQASSQQGSAQGSYNASPLSAPYVLPSGGPNGYPPSNVVPAHGHSPVSMPPSQPLSPYPPGPGGYLHVYPPHMYGGMPEYMHSQAASYSQWNGNGFPSHPSAAQSPPYAPNSHLLAYPQPLSHQPSIAPPSHQRKSISPSEEQQQSQLPPPTMIDHPPPPEESRPVAGYREIGTFNGGPDLDGTGHSNGSLIKLGSVVFGSIGMEAAGTPPHLESNESIDPEIAGEQTDAESLPKAFTTFSIGVTPDEPKPPRIRSRTSSAKPTAKMAPINGDLKSSPTAVADSALPTSAENQEVNDAQNRSHPIDLNGTEKKWQFGSTDLNAPLEQPETITSNINGPQSIHPSSVAAEMVDVPLGVMGISHSEQLPPLPLDLQPVPRMVGNDRLVQGLAHPQPLGDDFAIKDFRYGFGSESGPGYGMGVVQGDQLPQDGRRNSDMARDQDIREDGRRWRDEFEYDRSGRSGPGRDRDGDAGGMMGRPRRGSYGGYGYERGGYGGRRGRAGGPGGYGRSMHRPRGSFHAPPQPRQPPFTVTPPQQQFQPLMQYNDPSTPNGYYLPAQSPTSHHQGMAYLPIHTHAQVGYEAYTPIPQHLPQHGVTASGPAVPVPLYVNYQLDTRYRLLSQLEYYLSPQNMAQDYYLRQNMDREGWISIHLIASFKRVKALTNEPQLVKEVLSTSSVVQVNHDWVRMNDWERFVLPDAHPSVVETEHPNEADHQDEEEEEEEEDVVFIL
ncbi:hypothetical protein EYR38_002599 [Pleurotus pulmonarius]|nr:hypothetical protein EYR38_002599 [Pleurotus pulmonarius]